MALSTTLVTNEIKNAAGAEVEFRFKQNGPGARCEFAQVSESPAYPHRLSIAHQESGTGINATRRSVVRFDKTVASTVDATKACTISAYAVVSIPKGALIASTEVSNVIAELMSFLATQGGTTVLYDCTGTGADVLLNGIIV